ncbi:MAG: hypothetical protein RLZZ494_2190 [Pseudomonadota bacterium]|jgi:DNA-binding CsgD family transcriptional regulator
MLESSPSPRVTDAGALCGRHPSDGGALRPRMLGIPPIPLPQASVLALALDEMDYGVVLLDESFQVLHANHQARVALCPGMVLTLDGTALRVGTAADQRVLEEALLAAVRRGIRRLICLGDGEQRMRVSVVPLPVGGGWRSPAVMLAVERTQACARLTVQGFARLCRLSPGEEQVLQALCLAQDPAEIARQHGVALSTVRTQITNIRTKTGTDSIRDLVHHMSMLPPLIGALRQQATRASSPQGGTN